MLHICAVWGYCVRNMRLSGFDKIESLDAEKDLQALRNKYPEMFGSTHSSKRALFATGDSDIDGLFPDGGLPPGLLVELTGSNSSGKTAYLFQLLAGYQNSHQLAYVDCSTTFYPVGAIAAGVKVEQLLVTTANSSSETIRSAENLFRLTPARVVICDVTGRKDKLKMEHVHRLRIITSRYQGLVIFLTDSRSQMFPPSLMSLQMTVTRRDRKTIVITITRSKICPEGRSLELLLA